MSDPVQLASRDLHKAPNYGTGFAPYFLPLSLWVGAVTPPTRERVGFLHRWLGHRAEGQPGPV